MVPPRSMAAVATRNPAMTASTSAATHTPLTTK
jgi:hypothetical protein